MATIYVTKYALSSGIEKFDARLGDDGYAVIPGNSFQVFSSSQWFHTVAEAQVDAEKRRKKKIASLRKSIAKLEAMTFAVVEPGT